MRVEAQLGLAHPMILLTIDGDGTVTIDEEHRRRADGTTFRTRLAVACLSGGQLASLDGVLVHNGLRDFGPRAYVPGCGARITSMDGYQTRTTEMSPDAPIGGLSEGWLFPAGAASQVLDALHSIVFEARYRQHSGLAMWQSPRCHEPPAGVERTADEKAALRYFVAPPPQSPAPLPGELTTVFLSGRVCREELAPEPLGALGGAPPARKVLGRGRATAERVASICAMLRKSAFFQSGAQTGTAYDGDEKVVLYHRGGALVKALCYEVEMGARCGLSSAENEGLDAIRSLRRAAT